MNYELATQLKDAGFREDIYLYEKTREVGNAPTLSELIDACGKKFQSLEKVYKEFIAHSSILVTPRGRSKLSCFGKTAEEAVARLWLDAKNYEKSTDQTIE